MNTITSHNRTPHTSPSQPQVPARDAHDMHRQVAPCKSAGCDMVVRTQRSHWTRRAHSSSQQPLARDDEFVRQCLQIHDGQDRSHTGARTCGFVMRLISSSLVCRAACSGLSAARASSRNAVASRIMLRCRNRSAMVLTSMGGGVCLITILARATAPYEAHNTPTYTHNLIPIPVCIC